MKFDGKWLPAMVGLLNLVAVDYVSLLERQRGKREIREKRDKHIFILYDCVVYIILFGLYVKIRRKKKDVGCIVLFIYLLSW